EADTDLLHASQRPALERVERFMVGLLEGLEKNIQLRRALSVMQFKCEYVADLADDLAGAVRSTYRLPHAFEAAYREARRHGARAQSTPDIAGSERASTAHCGCEWSGSSTAALPS